MHTSKKSNYKRGSKSKNIIFYALFFVFYIFSVVSLMGADRITIVKEGKPNAAIILSKKPTQAAQWAAEELNSYIKKITGTRLPVSNNPNKVKGVKIFVGPSRHTKKLGISANSLRTQEFIIKTLPDAIVLLGRDSKSYGKINYSGGNGMWPGFNFFKSELGTIYAVDDFLRLYCGVHWYLPGKIGEVVPRKATIEIPSVQMKRKLSTLYRNPQVYYPITSTLYWWDVKKDITKIPNLPLEEKNKYWVRLKAGGVNFNANHSFGLYVKRFFKTHPEYFSQNEDGSPNTSQLCYSSEKVVDQVIKDAVEFFKGNRKDKNGISRFHNCTDDYLSIVQNDNPSFCRCKKCLKLVAKDETRGNFFSNGKTSNLQFNFVNKVARKLRKVCPDKKVSTLAYNTYYLPPSIKNFKFEPNVELMICRTNITSHNPLYEKDRYRLEDIKRWADLSKTFYTWEYFLFPQNNKYNVFPAVVPHRIAKEYKSLLSMPGFSGSFIQLGERGTKSRYANPVMDFLNVYTAMRLMDDKNTDVDKMLDTYYKTFFGPAENPIKTFFTEMEQIYLGKGVYARKKVIKSWDSRSSWTEICTQEMLKSLGGFIDKAKKLALKEPYKSRVQLIDNAIYQQMKTSSKRAIDNAARPSSILCLKSDKGPIGISSPIWRKTVAVSDFVDGTEMIVPYKTEVRALYDKKNLYVLFTCMNLKGKDVSASPRGRDSIEIFGDDTVEIFFDTGNIVGYFHIAANATGSLYDAIKGNAQWKAEFEVKTAKIPGGWKAMFIIPFSENVLPLPKNNTPLRINFCRTYARSHHLPSSRFSSWRPNGFHKPDNFGYMFFK
jgi:Domain of unknown function (DUF4838)/Carbohydrate family 9 binding domain-like